MKKLLNSAYILDLLSLLSRKLGWMQFVFGRQLRSRLVALDRLKRTLGAFRREVPRPIDAASI